ncbi:MAG: HAMP domain-containing sensor histidine kinase, partial [Candidatus Saccharibacteria bacterium]
FIIMLISFCFSLALFSVTTNDLQMNLRHQGDAFMRLAGPLGISPQTFEVARQTAFDELQHRELLNLLRFNLAVLALGGGASYLLARRTLRPLEEAMEAQGRFTGDASHELRTPLTAMRTEIEVALREPKLSSTESRDLLKSNLEEVIKLENLSQSLLQLARFGPHGNEFERLEHDVSEPLKDAVLRTEKIAALKNIKIHVELKHILVHGNIASLTELFATLLDNAVKYGKAGGTIEVIMKSSSKEATVTIIDDGLGIKADDLPHIFDRFYRSDMSRSKDIAEGYGLGLALASQIAAAHNGSIHATSVEGKGSTFTIHLPLGSQHPIQLGSSAVTSRIKKIFTKKIS